MEFHKSKFLFVLFHLLAILFWIGVGIVIGYFLFRNSCITTTPTSQQPGNGNNNQNALPDNKVVEKTTTDFVGNYVQATTPTGWKVVEYIDGNGTNMLSTGPVYKGLTGIEVQDANAKAVFNIKATYGIGGTDQCFAYYKFADWSQADYNTKNAKNQADFGVPAPIVDLTGIPYTSFSMLGLNFRRIGTNIYWDTVPNNNLFEAGSCAFDPMFPKFVGISFNVDGKKNTTYTWKIAVGTSNDDLLKLDGVLGTLKIK